MQIKTSNQGFEPPFTVRQRASILGKRFPMWAIFDKRTGEQVSQWRAGEGKTGAFPQDIVTMLRDINEHERVAWENQGGTERQLTKVGKAEEVVQVDQIEPE